MKIKKYIYNVVLSAMFFSLAMVLPFFTGQIPKIGNMLLPMHVPVMLCGILCGPVYGLAVGAISPIMRSLMLGMPVFYPSALAMAIECSTYGFFIGLFFKMFKKKNCKSVVMSLVCSMLIGRAVWGCAMLILLGAKGRLFTFTAFLSGAFVTAVPGIIMQLVLIPPLVTTLYKVGSRGVYKK